MLQSDDQPSQVHAGRVSAAGLGIFSVGGRDPKILIQLSRNVYEIRLGVKFEAHVSFCSRLRIQNRRESSVEDDRIVVPSFPISKFLNAKCHSVKHQNAKRRNHNLSIKWIDSQRR